MADLTREQIEVCMSGDWPTMLRHREDAPLFRAICTMALRAIDAESALAAAREAMPTDDVLRLVRVATSYRDCEGSEEEPVQREALDWLSRLDAFRASQAATKGGENG